MGFLLGDEACPKITCLLECSEISSFDIVCSPLNFYTSSELHMEMAHRPEPKSVLLIFPDAPGLLSISCQVPNHMHVRCSWVDLVKTFLSGEYTATFR